jgi:6-pyruvoyl-tetrahydropterin synthase
MYAKRSQVLKNIENKLSISKPQEQQAEEILELIELFMEPKLRPLTEKEVEEHVLVKQVHESRKEEVRNYVRNLDYEMKREFVPEDT